MAFAVFYHAAGCLPDNPEPEYVAESIALCARFIDEFGADYEREGVAHDTYTLSISEWDAEPEPYAPNAEQAAEMAAEQAAADALYGFTD